jgi:hypothetical protein
VATSIATSGVFGNPNGLPSGPTAHVAPVYPYVLAALIKLTSSTTLPALVTSLNILAASVLWALLPLVAIALELPARTGLLAGIAGAVNPLRHYVELNGSWEATLAGLALMAMVAFTFSLRRTWTRPTRALCLGVGWGVIMLLQPTAVSVFAVVAGVLATPNVPRPARLRAAVLLLAAVLITLAPWTIRNARTFGGVMFVRGDLGLELSVSNNDGALPSHENVLRNPLARHPHVSAVEFARRSQMGELQYDRSRMADALHWIAANPSRFASLTLRRIRLFWLPDRSVVGFSFAEWALTAFAGIGVWSMFRTHAAARWLILITWISYPILYYFIQSDERYRYPIEWSIVLVAAIGLFRVLGLSADTPDTSTWSGHPALSSSTGSASRTAGTASRRGRRPRASLTGRDFVSSGGRPPD